MNFVEPILAHARDRPTTVEASSGDRTVTRAERITPGDRESLQPLPPGQTGLVGIRVRDCDIDPGYRGDANQRTGALSGGWFIPGDVGRWSDDGELMLLGPSRRRLVLRGDDFPRNPMGKVLRPELQAMTAARFGRRLGWTGEDPVRSPVPKPSSAVAPALRPAAIPVSDRSGVLLCAASQPIYLAMAWMAALSVRRHAPDAEIWLCTDMTELALSRSPVFSGVTRIEVGERFASDWVSGKFCKLDALRVSPFRRTLYLDVDTTVRSARFREAFDCLDSAEIGMVEATHATSFTRAQLGVRLFNSGVIAYRATSAVEDFLRDWRAIALAQHQAIDRSETVDLPLLRPVRDPRVRRRMLMMDQLALAQLLRPDFNPRGLHVTMLPGAFNVRIAGAPGDPVVIDHHRSRKKLAARRIQEAARIAAREGWRDAPLLEAFLREGLEGANVVSPD